MHFSKMNMPDHCKTSVQFSKLYMLISVKQACTFTGIPGGDYSHVSLWLQPCLLVYLVVTTAILTGIPGGDYSHVSLWLQLCLLVYLVVTTAMLTGIPNSDHRAVPLWLLACILIYLVMTTACNHSHICLWRPWWLQSCLSMTSTATVAMSVCNLDGD